MYSDLFEHLGGGAMGRGAGSQSAPSAPAEKRPIVSLKAGKMTMIANVDRGTYSCTADPSRGEIRLACVNGSLEWQWYDRRQKKVVDRRVVPTAASPAAAAAVGVMSDDDATTAPSRWHLEKVESLPRTHKEDRVYVLTHHTGPNDVYDMYWMQDADKSKEEDVVAEFNKYLADPVDAVAQHGGGEGAAGGTSSSGSGTSSSSARASGASPSSQVDALSSILENLGMPQSSSDSAPSLSAGTNTLTLADLQGAMAGIQQQQQRAEGAVMTLADVVTPDAITALLQDEVACDRLVELLPEGQRTREMLEENLRSPQVQQTLRALTAALMPDDAGHVDGFLSVVANFQLDARGEGSGDAPSQETIRVASTNPIQAFLDAILRSVEKDKEDESKEEE
jgi:hypothetical protein